MSNAILPAQVKCSISPFFVEYVSFKIVVFGMLFFIIDLQVSECVIHNVSTQFLVVFL